MRQSPYLLNDPAPPTIGLIVLENDETLEDDSRRIFSPDEMRIHYSRIASDPSLSVDTLHGMEATLPAAAALLPPAARFAAVGYGCTSGTTMIGEARVAELVSGAVSCGIVTNPLTAAIAALQVLGVRRPAIISPYVPSIAQPLRTAFEQRGFQVPATLTFGEDKEANVARIDPASIADAARAIVADDPTIDGVFLSCTNLRTLGIIAPLEAELGMPVASSNQTLLWHMARAAGLRDSRPQWGCLWTI